jgi:hypothetical protein
VVGCRLSLHLRILYAGGKAIKDKTMSGAALAYISSSERGRSDGLLAGVAATLAAEGMALAGVVQINTEVDPSRPCHMDLRILGTTQTVRISQFLGTGSKGCRLDPAGLEEAVGHVERQLLASKPQLLILNKFGKQEGEGRGFRPLIAQALERDIPVLTAVSALNADRFASFADGMDTALPSDRDSILAWCRSVIA